MFTNITTTTEHKIARNELLKRGGQYKKDFADFAMASVKFFFNEGNHQINIINDLLAIAANGSAKDVGTMADWLAMMIPHKLERVKGQEVQFDTLKNTVSFRFGKKESKYDNVTSLIFVNNNPKWYLYGKPAVSSVYDADEAQEKVIKYLKVQAKLARKNGAPLLAASLEQAVSDTLAA